MDVGAKTVKDEMFFDELLSYSDNGLRDYQVRHKHDIYNVWKDNNSILLQMPTGTGKTRLFVSMINDFKKYHELHKTTINVLILTHRKELVEQIKNELYRNYGIKTTLITADNKDSHYKPLPVCVASIQTLQRRLEAHWYNYPFDFLIIDEAHHTKASTYLKIVKAYSYAKLLGVTATPYRLNGEGFTKEYQKLLISPSVKSYIEAGWLSNYDYYSIKEDDDIYKGLEEIPLDKYGEYDTTPLWDYMKRDRIRAAVVGSYLMYAKGKKGIVYTVNKAHNKQLCKEFNECGISAYYIDSETSSEERKKIVQRFKNGEIDVICNVDIFTEGFDCPDVEVIQLARPTKSLGLFLQQVGRGLRISPGKRKVLFIDNVGLYNRFGFPASKRMWRKHYLGVEVGYSGRFPSIDLEDPFDLDVKNEKDEIKEGNEEILLLESTGINEIIEVAKIGYLAEVEKKLKLIVDSIFDTNRKIYHEYVEEYSEEHITFSSSLIEDMVTPCLFVKGICDDEIFLSNKIKNEFKPVIRKLSIVYESYQNIDDYLREKEKMILERFNYELNKAHEKEFQDLSNYTAEQLKFFFEDNYGHTHIMAQKFSTLCDNHFEDLKWSEIVKRWGSINYKTVENHFPQKLKQHESKTVAVECVHEKKSLNQLYQNARKLRDMMRLGELNIGDNISSPDNGFGIITYLDSNNIKGRFDGKDILLKVGVDFIEKVIPDTTENNVIISNKQDRKRKAKMGDCIKLKYNGKEALVLDEYNLNGLSWLLVRLNDNSKLRFLNNPRNYDIVNRK